MFACMVVGTLAGVAQVGLKPMPGAIKPDFKKLNPTTGLKNLFNPQHFAVEGAKNVLKVVAVGAIAAHGDLPEARRAGRPGRHAAGGSARPRSRE